MDAVGECGMERRTADTATCTHFTQLLPVPLPLPLLLCIVPFYFRLLFAHLFFVFPHCETSYPIHFPSSILILICSLLRVLKFIQLYEFFSLGRRRRRRYCWRIN